MANEIKKYLIDTDVLVHIQNRRDSANIYNGIIALAEQGVVQTVRQVLDELKTHVGPNKIISPHRKKFEIPAAQQMTLEVSNVIEYLQKNAEWLCEWVGGKNPDPADPWLIAVGKVHGYTVVTNENPLSTRRIPQACKLPHIDCRCISGAHFLLEIGIVTEIRPEHISTAAFFGSGA